VRRRIGAGGFATVWLAYDEELDSLVAVKVLADNWSEDQHVRRRFVEEGRFLRKVESPHVVPAYDAGQLEDGRPYLVMAYADQGNLADRLDLSLLPLGEAIAVVTQVGTGLQALHQRGVLHRDIKPANVLFRTVDGQVRAMVGDLGLGKAMEASSRLTMIGGTPSYVAPEQARGEPLDERSDQYSLGALAYLLVGGRPPYGHASLAAATDPPPPPALDARLPAGVEAAIVRALAPARADRWPSIATFLSVLGEAVADHPEALAEGPQAWIPVDPELTQPGNRPSPLVTVPQLGSPPPVPAAGGERWPWPARLLVALVAVAVGAGAGLFAEQRSAPDVSVTDANGSLSVTVPRDWAAVRSTKAWLPPGQQDRSPGLSVGTSKAWVDPAEEGQGVFVGLLPGEGLPSEVPGHPECPGQGTRTEDERDGDPLVTVVWTGCPGVVIERVVRLTPSQLLWVQIRSSSQAVANRVLDSVQTHGL
jgi:hypothetical protein